MSPSSKTGQAQIALNACPTCGEQILENVRHCPACSRDWGPPNVRVAARLDERTALLARSSKATASAKRRGCTKQLQSLKSTVESSSHVVVAIPTLYARMFLSDRSTIYQNYEILVASGARTPAAPQHDVERACVGSRIFGSAARAIRYGALSLDGFGLPTYGKVFLQLRDVAIRDRVSFLEMNSYQFVDQFASSAFTAIPKGYLSTWRDRGHLAAVKLCRKLKSTHGKVNWAGLLISTDGKNRSKDEFIEAHIFDGFNASAVESASYAPSKTWTKEEKIDIRVIKDLMK